MKYHVPIMADKVIEYLNIDADGVYIDCTTGGGGHSIEIAKRLKGGHLYCIDQDDEALSFAKDRLHPYAEKITFIKSNFAEYKNILKKYKINQVNGVLMDIGVSSHQIDDGSRGFSYMKDAPLDMRMDRDDPFSAADVVNKYSVHELEEIFKKYGEERFSKRIAENIVAKRSDHPIKTTGELVNIIKMSIPDSFLYKAKGHPAKRVFQAIRIEVNGELFVLENVLPDIIHSLDPGGRLVVLTFHSLEDRIVKNCFKEFEKDCICPPELPICVCDKEKEVRILTKKPVTADEAERQENPRAESCKLRAVEKLTERMEEY